MFTARYGLSPYIKQTRLVFEGLKLEILMCFRIIRYTKETLDTTIFLVIFTATCFDHKVSSSG